jgi:hypothetical protein
VTNLDNLIDDIPRMSVEQLNELIYRLSAEGRLRYDTEVELKKARMLSQTEQLNLRKSALDKLARMSEEMGLYDNDPGVLRTAFDEPIEIDAKASLSLSKPDLDRG